MLKDILLFVVVSTIAFNDMAAQEIIGEYEITGNHEMVAAFKFNADSSFEFYFIYGAVDRTAKGTYGMHEGKVLLHGEKIPGKDFSIKKQKVNGEGTTIKISDNNTYLQKGVLCLFIKGNKQDAIYSDNYGTAHSRLTNCDTIFVMHTLYPDIMTTVKAGGSTKNNYFELTLNPSLAEVSFKDFSLTAESEKLSCSLPYLFESEKSVFVKR